MANSNKFLPWAGKQWGTEMARRRSYRDYQWYEPTHPRQVKGGIKAWSKRGAFASKWWGRRWIQVLESFNIGARLSRGRSYARRGQVADLIIEKGEIRAQVQGSRSQPYRVVIKLKTLTKKDWIKVTVALTERPILAARLLAGEMPEDIEAVFQKAGLSLFPGKKGDLETDCSCPDWSNPCKHIAAVYYLLAEAFDQDPFLLLKLRGVTREQFISLLGGAEGMKKQKIDALGKPECSSVPPQPLPTNAEAFWKGGESVAFDAGQVEKPTLTAVLPRRLGAFPFWRGQEDFLEVMTAIYQKATLIGEAAWEGECSPAKPESKN